MACPTNSQSVLGMKLRLETVGLSFHTSSGHSCSLAGAE